MNGVDMFDKRFKQAVEPISETRRQFVLGAVSTSALAAFTPGLSWASEDSQTPVPGLHGNRFDLRIGYQKVNFTGAERLATTINGSLPAPTLYWKENDRVSLRVTNDLAYDSSLHWHGMIVPSAMDGVPELSFAGIKPGETFEYWFDVKQSGTYWYHSHSGFQEQTGMYGAIVIAPQAPAPFSYDRDYVVVLSDWTNENPGTVYAKLKKLSHYYGTNARTLGDWWHDLREKGAGATRRERAMWNQMRMRDNDLSDVTGATYTFLMNGRTPAAGWTGLFKSGETILLRVINAAAMTLFDLRIPGLKMTVVAADGQYVEPISVDEFRLGVAETYDVIIKPESDTAYTVFAQAIDRSGYARGTLTPDPALHAAVPHMERPPTLSHEDLGMAHGAGPAGRDRHAAHGDRRHATGLRVRRPAVRRGPQVDMIADAARYRLDDPGVGLRNNGRRVLSYADLCNLRKTLDPREPQREIELHLTGNMERYMWSFNGVKFADAEPLRFDHGERLRITLINDTMMNHPIHLHGMWSEIETGDEQHLPRKHTVLVQPGSKISYQVTADARGRWAYHCHLLYHMPGMFREVRVA